MIDIKLDVTDHDVALENYDFQLVDLAEQVGQSIRIRLLFFRGEWFLDTAEGVPFYEDIFVKNPNLGAIDAAIKERILGTEGVTELLSYSSNYDASGRKLEISFEANTTYGPVTITEDI
jgi:hypothetical protein